MTSIPRIYALLNNGGVALVSSPVDIDVDHTLTADETAALNILLWMPPLAAVLLAQQLIDTAAALLTPDQIDQVVHNGPRPRHAQTVSP